MKTRYDEQRGFIIVAALRKKIESLEKENERLSAPLTIPDEEIEEWINELDYYASPSSFEKGVIRALEYLNAQRKGGG